MNNIQVLLRAVMLVGLILVLVSCTQAASPPAAPTPTVGSPALTPTAMATVSRRVGSGEYEFLE